MRQQFIGDKFDEKDAAILAKRIEARNNIKGPRVGDYVIFPDGHEERFSHNWGDGLQSSEGGSWYLDRNGDGDFSGALNPLIKIERLVNTGETKEGRFWFFHHDMWAAHNAVSVEAPCRVYKVQALVHLLPTRGGNSICGKDKEGEASEAEINCVTCPDCLRIHDEYMAEHYPQEE